MNDPVALHSTQNSKELCSRGIFCYSSCLAHLQVFIYEIFSLGYLTAANCKLREDWILTQTAYPLWSFSLAFQGLPRPEGIQYIISSCGFAPGFPLSEACPENSKMRNPKGS